MKTRVYFPARGILVLLCLLSFTTLISQPPEVQWHKAYGGLEKERGFTVMEDDDGIYLVAGSTESNTNGGSDAYLIKLDNNGEVIWEKSYGGDQDEQINGICPALYDGYILTGYTATDANGLSDIWVLWVNDEGDSLHSVKYGSYTSDQAYCIIPNIDQGYTISSRMSVYMMGDQIYILKLDQALDTIWTKTYGGDKQDYGHEIIQTTDGGYMIAGRSYTTVYPESGDAWALKLDSNGDTTWTRKYSGNDEDIFFGVVETDDGYMFAGQTRSFNALIIDMYVVRTDYNGNVIWSKIYGGSIADYAYHIDKTANNTYIISGYSGSFNDYDDVYVLEIDEDGEVLWQSNYGMAIHSERMYGATLTSDGGLIATGIIDYSNSLQDDLFVLKLGPGSTGMQELNLLNNAGFYNYPNPVTNQTTFFFEIEQKSKVSISVYNSYGQKLSHLFNGTLDKGKQHFEYDFSSFNSGIYFVKLSTENREEVCKVIISR